MPFEVGWIDTLKSSGTHRSKLVAIEFRRESRYEGFAHFSATPPLEVLNKVISLVATAQKDSESWYGEQNFGTNEETALMHTDISRT